MAGITTISFGLACAAFVVLSLLLGIRHRGKHALRWLPVACIATALWAVAVVVLAAKPGTENWIWPLDAVHSGVWLCLVATLLPGGYRLLPLRAILVVAAVAPVVYLSIDSLTGPAVEPTEVTPLVVLLAMSLLGLVAIEQVFRNADRWSREGLRLLCLGIGGLFAFDLLVYSRSVVALQLDDDLWSARGFVNAAIVPLLLIGAGRHPDWKDSVFVSRQMVFHSAIMYGVGLYLVAMALGGNVIRTEGGDWGRTLQATFFASALLLLAFFLFSSQLRARIKVFFAKHFQFDRYDYREAWLRLIATLSDSDGGTAPVRALRALADILETDEGQLWVSRNPGAAFESVAVIGDPGAVELPADHPLVEFLAETQWIVDTEEYRTDPQRYAHAFGALATGKLPAASVIVPLPHEERLLGVARLHRALGRERLNYEDHDLLKTVGRQLAVYLAQDLTREELAQTRQFEAFNRLTAFLMHDLKNLIAQQALVVKNAAKHKHRPEFIDDAMVTVETGVARMRQLLGQLQRGSAEPASARISLVAVLERVVADAASRTPVPTAIIEGCCEVRGDGEKLTMVIGHAVRNAQDATPSDGRVTVGLQRLGDRVRVVIEDTGSGMDAEFVRTRLFRPFDTTKGASGMGIGAYQIREYVQSMGGSVEVDSRRGEGTRLVLWMPALTSDDAHGGGTRRWLPSGRL